MPFAYRTDLANDDLRGIALQIGVESGRPLVAEQIIDELLDCCDQLAQWSDFSQLGTSASNLGPGIRLFSHRRWVIVFRYTDYGALILRIVDGSQDYMSWAYE